MDPIKSPRKSLRGHSGSGVLSLSVNNIPPFAKGRCEKIEASPFPCPLPQGGEGKYIEIQRKIPTLNGGRDRVGVENRFFSHLSKGG